MKAFSFPSKTFLLGEYAVLGGGPALVLAHAPLFQGSFGAGAEPAFPSGSPAYRLAQSLSLDPARFTFLDPHQKRGGFGASGAEFLTVAKLHPQAPEGQAFAWFARELYFAHGGSGSGVDLLVQGFGKLGPVLVRLEEKQLELLPATLGAELILFHTGLKLPTHEHLRSLSPSAMLRFAPEVERAQAALRQQDLASFASALRAFAQGLAESGFVAPHTAAALRPLQGMEGVLAAKGCGAMGSDVILVLGQGAIPGLAGWAKAHSLVEVARAAI